MSGPLPHRDQLLGLSLWSSETCLWSWQRAIDPVPRDLPLLFTLIADHDLFAYRARWLSAFLRRWVLAHDLPALPLPHCAHRWQRLLGVSPLPHRAEVMSHQPPLTAWLAVLQQPESLRRQTLKTLRRHPALPPSLDDQLPDQLPRAPGVYRFYDEREVLLYVGKSIDLRTRVLSHFRADQTDPQELRLSQLVHQVSWTVTAGPMGALLQESEEVKRLQPLFNRKLRRVRDVFQLRAEPSGRLTIVGCRYDEDDDPALARVGLFRRRSDAQRVLRRLVTEHELCPARVGLEPKTLRPCFHYQLRRCRGVCAGQETPRDHDQRAAQALASLGSVAWPYPGPILIEEWNDTQRHYYALHQWVLLGHSDCRQEAEQLAFAAPRELIMDRDIFDILKGQLRRQARQLNDGLRIHLLPALAP